MNSSTDSIERKILLKAPRSRVWRALSNAEEFGDWFGVALKGKTFAAGQRVQGQVTYPGYEHVVWDVLIERLEPERLLSWRWHPAAVEPSVDYSKEPSTLVVFELMNVAWKRAKKQCARYKGQQLQLFRKEPDAGTTNE